MKKYHSLIQKIKQRSHAPADESQDALELVVENIAIHLTDYTRRGFAAVLPRELRVAALMVPTADSMDDDIIDRFMDIDNVNEQQAHHYIKAAWQVLSEFFDREAMEDIVAELPRRVLDVLSGRKLRMAA